MIHLVLSLSSAPRLDSSRAPRRAQFESPAERARRREAEDAKRRSAYTKVSAGKKTHVTRDDLLDDLSLWTRHTVIVVDQSASMKKHDVANMYGATRSAAVWTTIASQFIDTCITQRLEEEASGERDAERGVTELITVRAAASRWCLSQHVMRLMVKRIALLLFGTSVRAADGTFHIQNLVAVILKNDGEIRDMYLGSMKCKNKSATEVGEKLVELLSAITGIVNVVKATLREQNFKDQEDIEVHDIADAFGASLTGVDINITLPLVSLGN
jgi:hypothetical protein